MALCTRVVPARFAWLLTLLAVVLFKPFTSHADNFVVSNLLDTGGGSLRQAMIDANAAGAGPHTIDLTGVTGTITLGSFLPLIATDVEFNGPGSGNLSIDGADAHRVFFADSGQITFRNLTVTNGRAKGGNGGRWGGGGLGAGAGLFVNENANVTLEGVVFDSHQAIGGNSTTGGSGVGGGGGLGGNGGNALASAGRGGGGGFFGNGGDSADSSGAGGGGLLGDAQPDGTGGAGGGGDVGQNGERFGGGGGGVGFAIGGNGGDFGGGGGDGGNGGYGGGAARGGISGFGAGGPGARGFSGAHGGVGNFVYGGGGAGLGGAVFVRVGGQLTLSGVDFSNNIVQAGISGAGESSNGEAVGADLYLHDTRAFFDVAGGQVDTLASGVGGFSPIEKRGDGELELTGVNSYTGGTFITAGTVAVRTIDERLLDSGPVEVLPGARLLVDGINETIGQLNGTGDVILAGGGKLLIGGGDTGGMSYADVSGSGAFAKTGAGKMTLRGAYTPSGGVRAEQGTLIFNGAMINSTLRTEGGTLVLDAGDFEADVPAGADFAHNSGTLRLTDLTGFTVNNPTLVANRLGGTNVGNLSANRRLEVDHGVNIPISISLSADQGGLATPTVDIEGGSLSVFEIIEIDTLNFLSGNLRVFGDELVVGTGQTIETLDVTPTKATRVDQQLRIISAGLVAVSSGSVFDQAGANGVNGNSFSPISGGAAPNMMGSLLVDGGQLTIEAGGIHNLAGGQGGNGGVYEDSDLIVPAIVVPPSDGGEVAAMMDCPPNPLGLTAGGGGAGAHGGTAELRAGLIDVAAGGALSLSGGNGGDAGGLDICVDFPGNGGRGGNGGTLLISGGELRLDGLLGLSGGEGGQGNQHVVGGGSPGANGVNGAKGVLTLDGGKFVVDAADMDDPNHFRGILQFTSGELQLTDPNGYALGQSPNVTNGLLPNPILSSNRKVTVDNTFTIGNNETVTLNGDGLTVGSLNIDVGTLRVNENVVANLGGDNHTNSDAINTLFGSFINFGGSLTNESGGRITLLSSFLTTADGLTNLGELNLINSSVTGPVHLAAGSQVNIVGGAGFNGPVTGTADFEGTGNISFFQGYDPGFGPAEVEFNGDVFFSFENQLRIDVDGLGSGEHDLLLVEAAVQAGATLHIDSYLGFAPALGDRITIIDADLVTGTFDTLLFDILPGELKWVPDYSATSVDLVATWAADFDLDFDVDANDLAIWQSSYGVDGSGDATGDGQTNGLDFLAWQQQLGSEGSPLVATAAAVPESSSLLLVTLGLFTLTVGADQIPRRTLE